LGRVWEGDDGGEYAVDAVVSVSTAFVRRLPIADIRRPGHFDVVTKDVLPTDVPDV